VGEVEKREECDWLEGGNTKIMVEVTWTEHVSHLSRGERVACEGRMVIGWEDDEGRTRVRGREARVKRKK
jgi:hypothetical protein